MKDVPIWVKLGAVLISACVVTALYGIVMYFVPR